MTPLLYLPSSFHFETNMDAAAILTRSLLDRELRRGWRRVHRGIFWGRRQNCVLLQPVVRSHGLQHAYRGHITEGVGFELKLG